MLDASRRQVKHQRSDRRQHALVLCVPDARDSLDAKILTRFPLEAITTMLPHLKKTLLVAVLVGAAGATASALASLGADNSYSFHDAPLNSMGVKSLTDLRGKPIVIDFWGRN
jgi:hypothetical protein